MTNSGCCWMTTTKLVSWSREAGGSSGAINARERICWSWRRRKRWRRWRRRRARVQLLPSTARQRCCGGLHLRGRAGVRCQLPPVARASHGRGRRPRTGPIVHRAPTGMPLCSETPWLSNGFAQPSTNARKARVSSRCSSGLNPGGSRSGKQQSFGPPQHRLQTQVAGRSLLHHRTRNRQRPSSNHWRCPQNSNFDDPRQRRT